MAYGLKIRDSNGNVILDSNDLSAQVVAKFDLITTANIEIESFAGESSSEKYNYYNFKYVDGTGPLSVWNQVAWLSASPKSGYVYPFYVREPGSTTSRYGWFLRDENVVAVSKNTLQPAIGATYYLFNFYFVRNFIIPFASDQKEFEVLALETKASNLVENTFSNLEELSGNDFYVSGRVIKSSSYLNVVIEAESLHPGGSVGYVKGQSVSESVSGSSDPNLSNGFNRSNFQIYVLGR